jgi:hypothetical protein
MPAVDVFHKQWGFAFRAIAQLPSGRTELVAIPEIAAFVEFDERDVVALGSALHATFALAAFHLRTVVAEVQMVSRVREKVSPIVADLRWLCSHRCQGENSGEHEREPNARGQN